MEIKENVAYWCKTEELAKEFLKECEKQEIKWATNESITTETYWEVYERETCYKMFINPNKEKVILYASKQFYKYSSGGIIEFKGEQKINKEEIQAEKQANKMPKGEIWKPKEDEDYYCVDIENDVRFENNYNTLFDINIINCGNCYQTQKKAEFEAQREKYTRLFRQYVEQHSEPIDRNNIHQTKWYATYDIDEQRIEIDDMFYCLDAFQIYASSKEVIQNAIDFIGEDNFKKYILQVE